MAVTKVDSAAAMDIDEVKELIGQLVVTFLNQSDQSGFARIVTFPQINFNTVTVAELKEMIVQQSQNLFKDSNEIDIIYKGGIITDNVTSTLQHLKIRPNSIVNAIKSFKKCPETKSDDKKKFRKEELQQVSIALRTAFVEPSFMKAIKKICQPEMLENLIAIAPQLAEDSTGLAIISMPILIVFYSEMESLQKLAEERPWVIDAFNFIAAAIHQERQASGGSSVPRGLADFFRGEDGEMDDDEEMSSGNSTPRTASSSSAASRPRSAQSQSNVFTREHVQQAIRSALPLDSAQSSGSGTPQPPLSSTSSYYAASASANQNRPLTAAGSNAPSQIGGGSPLGAALATSMQQIIASRSPDSGPRGLSSQEMARAILQSINNLPHETRVAQLNLLRDRIQQISTSNNQSGAVMAPQGVAAAEGTTNSNSSSSGEFQNELAQMMELGITDEQLALRALRVSDGDVGTASDLIFSGWNGEGAEDEGGQ